MISKSTIFNGNRNFFNKKIILLKTLAKLELTTQKQNRFEFAKAVVQYCSHGYLGVNVLNLLAGVISQH